MSFSNNSFTNICENKFINQLESFSLPSRGYNVLLGLSGGADSTALLFLLNKFKGKYGYKLYAIHINHMIRGGEAERDEAFCRELCASVSVPFHCVRANVPEIAKQRKIGLEEAARNIRYSEFEALSRKLSDEKPCFIATAHNADDNAETVIFNLTRGTSLTGLSGIKKSRQNIIRPILKLTKAEIMGYCDENGIKYITDSTNADTAYSRNRIRNLVIPELKAINPSLCKVVARTSENLSSVNEYMELKAREFINSNAKDGKIDIFAFNIEHIALKKYILSLFIKEFTGNTPEDVHINDIIGLCVVNQSNSFLNIGGGYIAKIIKGKLTVDKQRDFDCEEYDIPLNFGITEIPKGIIGIFSSDESDKIREFKNIYKKSIQTAIKSDRIKGALRARSRKAGDVYSINGVNRKVKKVLSEIQPDLSLRNALPIIYDSSGILWIPGARSATGTFPKQEETSVILLYSFIEQKS